MRRAQAQELGCRQIQYTHREIAGLHGELQAAVPDERVASGEAGDPNESRRLLLTVEAFGGVHIEIAFTAKFIQRFYARRHPPIGPFARCISRGKACDAGEGCTWTTNSSD